MLIQGDSLTILCGQAQAVLAALESGDLDDARDEARYLVDDLEERVLAYVDVLDRAGIALPFRRPASQEQPTRSQAGENRRTTANTDGHWTSRKRQDVDPGTDSYDRVYRALGRRIRRLL